MTLSRTDDSFHLSVAGVISFVRRYPIPTLAIAGLVIGGIVYSISNLPEFGKWIWLATLITGGAPIIWDTIYDIRRGHFASDIVATLAILTALLTNEALPGVIIVIMQSGGKALEDYALRKASSSLDALLARSPHIAYRKKVETLEEIDVTDIKVGDILVVRPGDLVPVDGHVTRGHVVIDESALTGEPLPKEKDIDDKIFSGTVNVGDAFEMIADKVSEESQYAKIVQPVKKAQAEKAPIQRLADRYAIWFTPITIVISIFGWLITRNPETILSVLVVATPCSLIFATPVSIMSGINKAAKLGIIVKSGKKKKELESQKSMLAFIGINRVLVGAVVYSDKIRNGVKLMMQRLCELGIKETVILTGDSFDNAKTISEQAGVTRFESDLSPEQKVISVKKLGQRYRNIIMVGDGINDAPALAAATVGIAMGAHGTAVSAEAADMVLLVDDITKVSQAVEIGRRTVQIAKQSIYVGLGASFIFMVIASFGVIPPTVGAVLQEIFDVAVILNALRAR